MSRASRSAQEKLRQVRAQVYRQHILEAAEEVFAAKGVADASMQEIGRRAGVSMGTIYSVFPSKEAVLAGVLQWRGEEILQLAREAVRSADSALGALRGLMRRYVEYFVTHPHFLRMHLRLGAAWTVSPQNGSGRALVWEEIHRLQAELMERGVREGTFVDEDPALLARLFSGIDQVLLSRWVEMGMPGGAEELYAELEKWVGRLLWVSSVEGSPRRATSAQRKRVQR